MSELPTGWKFVKVREAGRVQLGRQRSPEFHTGASMRPYLRVANVHENELRLDDIMEMHFDAADLERYELRPGDVLLNEGQSRELIGRPAMYRGELPGACFTNSLIRFQASENVDPEFALQLFRNWMRQGDFQALAQITTNIAHLGAGRFADMDFPLPPLREQRRIVAKLDALQSKSRRAKDALNAVPALLERFRQSVLAAAFRGDLTADWRAKNPDVEPASELLKRIRVARRRRWEGAELVKMKAKGKAPGDDRWKAKYEEPEAVDMDGLPELPKGWAWASVDEVVSGAAPLCYGVVQPGEEHPAGTHLVRVCDLVDGSVDEERLRTISATVDAEYVRSRVEGGELLISIVGTIGRVAVVPAALKGANIARALARVTLMPELVNVDWCAAWFTSEFMQHRLQLEAREVARKTLNLETLRRCPVPVAAPGEMAGVAVAIVAAFTASRSVESGADDAQLKLVALDRAILAKAFRGELVPQGPSEEPASKLLARIGAERDGPAKPKGHGTNGKQHPTAANAARRPRRTSTTVER